MKTFFLVIALLNLANCGPDKTANDIVVLSTNYFSGEFYGCHNFEVVNPLTDRNILLRVKGDREKLGLKETPVTFNLADTSDLTVEMVYLNQEFRTSYFCNDTPDESGINELNNLKATEGLVSISILDDYSPSAPIYDRIYEISLAFEDVKFIDTSEIKVIKKHSVPSIKVGINPG